ncbi:MAG: DUF805 domain-containing protein [Neisseriaceae bacterium]|nr:DUF805 domain-containing protein [Neisseriaceae bacterium]
MSFVEAIKTCLNKYATFDDRAMRSEYWWFQLFIFLVCLALSIFTPLLFLFAVAQFLPNIAVSVRRMHDTGKSGWWVLLAIIPWIGGIIFAILCIIDTQPQDNQYGTNLKKLAIEA